MTLVGAIGRIVYSEEGIRKPLKSSMTENDVLVKEHMGSITYDEKNDSKYDLSRKMEELKHFYCDLNNMRERDVSKGFYKGKSMN